MSEHRRSVYNIDQYLRLLFIRSYTTLIAYIYSSVETVFIIVVREFEIFNNIRSVRFLRIIFQRNNLYA